MNDGVVFYKRRVGCNKFFYLCKKYVKKMGHKRWIFLLEESTITGKLRRKKERVMMKKEEKKRREKCERNYDAIWLCILAACVFFVFAYAYLRVERGRTEAESETEETESDLAVQEEFPATEEETEEASSEQIAYKREMMVQADRLSAAYDYDEAIGLLKSLEGYEEDSEILEKLRSYEEQKASCVPVSMEEVTHVFYHSLVVDPERAFANQEKDPQAAGNNQWMTTVGEFKKITQEMYDRGYVIVSIHDLIDVSVDENGNTVFFPANIMLPPGKRAYVLSLDDLSYYHCYDNYGYAAKMVLNEAGNPVCDYIQADGTHVTGAYDVVPILDDFLEEHPDASYRGAKGLIALTGYNGVLGYRTDSSYLDNNGNLDSDKRKWLEEHPDFDIERERAEAKRVADAMKEDGWEFASHTWGHIRIKDASLERLMRDTQKWKENVEPIVGNTDAIVFAHGQDLGDWGAYQESNAKYQYLKEQGYRIFCNVDSNLYRTWFGKDYLRQGRRNLDGYRIYNNAVGKENNVSDLFDAAEVLDPMRPPVPKLR